MTTQNKNEKEEIDMGGTPSIAEELFGADILQAPLEHDGLPEASIVESLLSDEEARAVGFCEACGSTFGISEAGVRYLELEVDREGQYVSLPSCSTCKYQPAEEAQPTVKSLS